MLSSGHFMSLQAFLVMVHPSTRVLQGRLQPLGPNVFVSPFREILSACGLQAKRNAGHSFRRGGASWAFNSGGASGCYKYHRRLEIAGIYSLYCTNILSSTRCHLVYDKQYPCYQSLIIMFFLFLHLYIGTYIWTLM